MQKYWKRFLLLLLAGGFLCGILVVNFCGDTYFRSSGIRLEEIWDQINNAQIVNNRFFAYLLCRRLGVFFLLWLLGHTFIGIFALSVYAFWLGCAVGILLTLSFLQVGLRGIFFIVACLLPQDLFYGLAFVRVFQGVWIKEKSKFSSGAEFFKKERWKAGTVLLMNLPPMIAGILLECHVNPVWIRGLFKVVGTTF